MINLKELKLSDLLPESITYDKRLAAIAAALDRELQQITASIEEAAVLSRIDELPEALLDILAWQFHVDFYEPLGLNIEKKRQLVKNSLNWHRKKGTKSVLREILSVLFLKDFDIREWFEYGGEPFFFKIVSRDFVDNREDFFRLISAINEVKNERSWLESITIETNLISQQYGGGAITLAPRLCFCDSQHDAINIMSAQRPGSAFGLSTRLRFTEPAVGSVNIQGRLEGAAVFSMAPRIGVTGAALYKMSATGEAAVSVPLQ